VLGTVGTLIVFGGLGTAVLAALPAAVRGRRLALQARLVLWTTAGLLVMGTLSIAALEWNLSLGGLAWPARLLNAAFQSVTLRTAGFNSVDVTELAPATVTIMVLFMFVGGSPGSTAGGIKTTTFALLLLALGATLRGRNRVVTFGRQVRQDSLFKAAAITTAGFATVLGGFLALQATQPAGTPGLLFEVVSAVGTVGLSLGATTRLDEIGKIVIVTCMFLGRIGPLTLFMVLVDRPAAVGWRYPEESVSVG